MIVAIAGATGNMMKKSIRMILDMDKSIQVRILTRNPTAKCVKEWSRVYSDRFSVIKGNIFERSDVEKLVKDATYMINAAAIIPPKSDRDIVYSTKVNYNGAVTVADVIKETNPNCALIHISTIAIYGNRNYKHPWGRVGDPLLPSVYDYYGSAKLKGERYVVECGLKKWAVIRQTGMLYSNILMNNINDPLMFHTPLNVPIEWSTDEDSSRLIKNIIEKDMNNECNDFWYNIYSLGGGESQRVTGFDTFQIGFSLMGGDAYNFVKPNWHAIRNFHCFWMCDSDELEKMFHFQNETFESFFKRAVKEHPIIRMGRFAPKYLITFFVFKRLLKDKHSPMYWIEHNDIDRVNASFGGMEKAKSINEDWNNFYLLKNNQNPDTGEFIDYEKLRDIKNATVLSHGYDENKDTITIDDVKNASEYRGLRCVDTLGITGCIEEDDYFKKLLFEDMSTREKFSMSPFGLIRAGYGSPFLSEGNPWHEDKINSYPFYNNVWVDSHSENERTWTYKNIVD